MTKSRNSNIEILRFVLMIGLCAWHILMHGYGYKDIESGNFNPSYYQLVLMGILAPAADCFVFISGYFGIKLNREKIVVLFVQATFYYILCLVFRNCFPLTESLSRGYLLTNLLPITNKAWWFLAWYFFLMLLSPIIDNGIEKVGKDRFLKILFALIVINCFGTWLNRLHTGSDFAGLLTIYLIGRYAKLYGHDNKPIVYLSAFVLATVLQVLLIVLSYRFQRLYFTWNFLMLCNPVMVIQTVSLVMFFIRLKPRYNLMANTLGAHCFAIYLITEFTGNFFYRWWIQLYNNRGIFTMFIMMLIVCVFFCLIDCIRSIICKPIVSLCLKSLK